MPARRPNPHREELARVRAVIASLRAELRKAQAAKKARMRELGEQCRAEQKALGKRLREKRARVLAQLRASAAAARSEARTACRKRKEDAKRTSATVLDALRRDLVAERTRAADLRRIARETHTGRVRCDASAHASDAQVRAELPSEFRMLFDKVKHAIKLRPGTSRVQNFLQFAAAHPGELFASVEPKQANALAEATEVLARAERALAEGHLPNAYELKRAERIARLRGRAAKRSEEAEAARARGQRIGDAIPMGQPILVGHHSQKRHERDIKRMRGSFDTYMARSDEAKALTRRADHAERNAAVSSDDPNALLKLRAKLAEEEAERVRMHAANAALRAGGDVVSALRVLGFSDDRIATLRERRRLGEAGFQNFHMRNSSQEIARLKKRIAHLEAQAAKAPPSEETFGPARISEADNRVRIAFPGVPPEATRRALKSEGFRWAPSMGVWQRHASTSAWHAARRALAHAGAT